MQDGDSPLTRLAEAARSRVDLCDRIRARLPDELAGRLMGCNVRDDGTLVVIASSPDWAPRFRFLSGELLEIARRDHPEITRLKVSVAHSPDSG